MPIGSGPRPPRFEDALDLHQRGLEQLAAYEEHLALGHTPDHAAYAAALFSAAQSAAALRLITPVHIP